MKLAVFAILVLASFTIADGDAMDHSDHGMIDVTANPPTVSVEALKDLKGGWNVHITTTNFKFAPEKAGSANAPNEGHAHVFVDGVKVGRAYSEWYYMGNLEPGDHEITATLNANDHSDYAVNGEHVSSSVTVREDRVVAPSAQGQTQESLPFDISHAIALIVGIVGGVAVSSLASRK